jgi:amino acid transporter
LPLGIGQIVGNNNVLYHLLITIGLFGLIASFHGIILAAGRASFEFGRVKMAPSFLGKINPRFQTPSNALLVNMAIGIIALAYRKNIRDHHYFCFWCFNPLYYINDLIAETKKEGTTIGKTI